MKKKIVIICIIVVIASAVLFAAFYNNDDPMAWKTAGYDLSVPVLGEDGWYMVFEDDFNGTKLNEGIVFSEKYTGNKEIWTTSPHAIRWASNDEDKPEQACWWCPQMVEVKDSKAIIHSRYEENMYVTETVPLRDDSQAVLKQDLLRVITTAIKAPVILCFSHRHSDILNAG